MEKLTKEDLVDICVTPRKDHPGRKTPENMYRGEPQSGVRTRSGFHEFPVQHNFGRPIRGNVALSTIIEE